MTIYKFKAVNYQGKTESGKLTAESRDDAIARLRSEYQIVSEVKEFKEKEDFRDTLQIRKVNEKNLALVCEQFSIILKAGLPIIRTVEMVANQTEDKYLKKILQDVAQDVAGGRNLADSFALRGPKLPVTFVETIRAGEESGALDTAFARLKIFFSKRAKTREKVISALTYPALVLAVAVVVIFIIMIVAVPQFTAAFSAMGNELPLPTRMIMGLSDFFVSYAWIIAILIIICIAGLKLYESKPERKCKTDRLRLKIPVLGRIHLMNGCSQFANTLATMMAAGLPAIRAIQITGRALGNTYLRSCVLQSAEDVQQGFRIGKSLKQKGCFPDLLTEMTTIGEETGSIEETLTVVGDYYDNEVDVVTTRATKLIEPLIICILAVFVVIVLLAVYAPMFSIYDSI